MIDKITSKVKVLIQDKKEVSPRMYNDIFHSVADEMGVAITDMETCDLNQSFDNHCEALEYNAQKAITAITEKDSEALIIIQSDVENLKSEIAQLREVVYKDDLTKVFNRKYVSDKIAIDDKFISSGFMVILDMNNLKYINDNIGHIVGDKAIIYLAKSLLKVSEKTIRFGGDEFLLFLEDDDLESCYVKMAGLRDRIATRNFIYKGHEFSISFAFAVIAYDETKTFKDTLEIADAEMYKDKERTKALIAKNKKKS